MRRLTVAFTRSPKRQRRRVGCNALLGRPDLVSAGRRLSREGAYGAAKKYLYVRGGTAAYVPDGRVGSTELLGGRASGGCPTLGWIWRGTMTARGP